MKIFSKNSKRRGFTLMETMIALAVMTVLITGFLAVFGPAAGSIRKALTIDEINRMQATVERELGTLRIGTGTGTTADSAYQTSFEKAMNWIAKSNDKSDIIILYKYRGNPKASPRNDGTLEPVVSLDGKAGENYVIQPMARRLSDKTLLEEDLKAVEGRAFFVKMTQLIYDTNGSMKLGTVGKIVDPSATGGGADFTGNPNTYPEAVIAYQGSFYILPTVSYDYVSGAGFDPAKFDKAAFTRNMAVRR